MGVNVAVGQRFCPTGVITGPVGQRGFIYRVSLWRDEVGGDLTVLNVEPRVDGQRTGLTEDYGVLSLRDLVVHAEYPVRDLAGHGASDLSTNQAPDRRAEQGEQNTGADSDGGDRQKEVRQRKRLEFPSDQPGK